MPIDINWLRKEKGGDPDKWRQIMKMRFRPVEQIDKVIALDEEWRKVNYEVEQLRKELGAIQKKVADAKKSKNEEEAARLIESMADLRAQVPIKTQQADDLKATLDAELNKIPNEVDPSVPISNNEDDNAVVATWGTIPERVDGLLHHHEILEMIDGYEPERGVKVAGHRGYFLKGWGLMLNQALINYGLNFLMGREYTPLQPPYFMNRDAMSGVAQLEDFDEQLYKVTGENGDDKYLIATSEQPICAFHKDEWIQEKDLPKKYGGLSTCFRKEAGAHGRDTWGIFRVHQFEKVEQFVVCNPEESVQAHKDMIATAQAFYESLGIAYRVVNIVSGELNNAAIMKYDLEGYFPTLGIYRELVSCSNCTDYQSRAMEIRCGVGGKKTAEATKKYVHLLNGTLCATTRTICAILENYQTPEGVKVPEVLRPYMGGKEFIPFVKPKPTRVAGEALGKKKEEGDTNAQRPNAVPTSKDLLSKSSSKVQEDPLQSVLKSLQTSLEGKPFMNGFVPSRYDREALEELHSFGIHNGDATGPKVLGAGWNNVCRWLKSMRQFPDPEIQKWE